MLRTSLMLLPVLTGLGDIYAQLAVMMISSFASLLHAEIYNRPQPYKVFLQHCL
jgi:hypothetical protein